MLRAILAVGFLIGGGGAASAPSFAVVIHGSSPYSELRFAELRGYFTGAVKRWPNGGKVVLVERDQESAAYRFLLGRVLNMSAAEYKRRLAGIEFSGETPVTLKVLNSEEAACRFVFNVPGSIALIETKSLDTADCRTVRTVRIDGKLPGEEGYRLR